MPDDNIDDNLIDEEPEDEQEIVGPERSGLSDESKEAIHGGAERMMGNRKSNQVSGVGNQSDNGSQPKTENRQPKTAARPPSGKPSVPTTDNRQPTTSAGSASRAANLAQSARVGTDIARNPREGAQEAGKAVAQQAGKKATKEAVKKLVGLATEEVGGTLIIEAADKLNDLAKKVPGVSGLFDWLNRHKLATAIVLVLLWASPVLVFAAMLGAGGGDCSAGTGICTGAPGSCNILNIAKSYIPKINTYSQSRRTDFDGGFSDCSSFVSKVLRDAGVNIPITTTAGMASMWDSGKNPYVKPVIIKKGVLTPEEAALIQPGDIIIWGNAYSTNDTHTAILSKYENGRFYYVDSTSRTTGLNQKSGVDERSRTLGQRSVWGIYRVVGATPSPIPNTNSTP